MLNTIPDASPRIPASFEVEPPPIPEEQISGALEADVVVVGEGLAGLCAALTARQAGADTLIISASARPVGRRSFRSLVRMSFRLIVPIIAPIR